MTDLLPQQVSRDRFFDRSVLSEFSEDAIGERIAKIPFFELIGERSALIARLACELRVTAPRILWSTAELAIERSAAHEWLCTLSAELSDPHCCAWSVEWPSDGKADYDPDSEAGVLKVKAKVSAASRQLAREIFDHGLARFQTNLAKTADEMERYNAALPYLISLRIDHRLDWPSDWRGF